MNKVLYFTRTHQEPTLAPDTLARAEVEFARATMDRPNDFTYRVYFDRTVDEYGTVEIETTVTAKQKRWRRR